MCLTFQGEIVNVHRGQINVVGSVPSSNNRNSSVWMSTTRPAVFFIYYLSILCNDSVNDWCIWNLNLILFGTTILTVISNGFLKSFNSFWFWNFTKIHWFQQHYEDYEFGQNNGHAENIYICLNGSIYF